MSARRFCPALLICCFPPIGLCGLLMVVAGAGASGNTSAVTGCGAAGTGQQLAGVSLDAEQMGNAQTIVQDAAGRELPVYAAVIAVDTAFTESSLRNSTVQVDHDSEGLFQQRVSIYTKPVADDPIRATNAFLDRMVQVPNWQNRPVGDVAQAVQGSARADRYPQFVGLAQQLVGHFWMKAAASVPPSTPSSAPKYSQRTEPPVCAGGGGAGRIVGPSGNTVAGTTTVPSGFVITGSPAGNRAVQFALDQLGKPYVFGAAGPDAWDCSGLTMGAWAAAGVGLPHWTLMQVHRGTPEPADLSEAVGGDLVFIPGSDGTAQNPGHVGMLAGYVDRANGRDLYLVQAPMTGVPVELTEASQWRGQITDVRHIR